MINYLKKLKNNKYLFLITISYFLLSVINIHFALLGLICMALPLILLIITNKKTYCQGYCPRSSLFTTCGKLKPYENRKTPKIFITGNLKWIVLFYFFVNIFIITMTTIGVYSGRIVPMNFVRFFLFFKIGALPQIFALNTSPWIIHLSYRFFSMIMTTTIIGLVLALIYKPKTWCTICPISTISNVYTTRKKKVEGRLVLNRKKITPESAKSILKEDANSVLLDVRTIEEYNQRHIENAILIPLDSLKISAEAKLKDKEAKIIVYCQSGMRSSSASKTLQSLGYTNVFNLGSINSWFMAN